MSRLDTVRELMTELSPGERAQALQWLVRLLGHASPGIERTAGVCGGEPCLLRTRVPVWVLVQARKLGSSESDILRAYPSLRAEDLSNAWSCYEFHGAEIDRQIAENEAAWKVARLYADENMPLPVVEELRRLGHDVLTMFEDGKANQRYPDASVLQDAATHERVVVTLNRKLSPIFCCGRQSVASRSQGRRGSGPYSLKPLRQRERASVDYAFASA